MRVKPIATRIEDHWLPRPRPTRNAFQVEVQHPDGAIEQVTFEGFHELPERIRYNHCPGSAEPEVYLLMQLGGVPRYVAERYAVTDEPVETTQEIEAAASEPLPLCNLLA